MESPIENTVKLWRERARMTQEELADRAITNTKRIHLIEKGYMPDIALANRIAKALNVSTDMLFQMHKES